MSDQRFELVLVGTGDAFGNGGRFFRRASFCAAAAMR